MTVSISRAGVHVNRSPLPVGTSGGILNVLRTRTDRPDLEYAVPPVSLSGGFWAEIFSIRLADPPPELAGDLVVRVMPDALLARKEITVQSGVVAQGFPAPAVRFTADADNAIGRAFMVMELAPGTPLLGGLSATSILAHLPQLARRLPVVLADAAVRLHSIDPAPVSRQLDAIGPRRAATSVSEFLQALSAAADDLGRPDLAGAGQRLAELRPPSVTEVVCHGDLHPFNVLVDRDRVTVIDWTASLIADPAYDVALTWLLLADPPLHLPKPLRSPMRVATGLVARSFLRHYRRRAPILVSDVSLRWHVGLHCLRAFVQVAGWARARELASHLGHRWLTSGAAFAARLSRLTGIAVGGRGRPDITG
ncbi:MAG TPA: phosphotransferase [Candidatus Dormibacteraeota bacterium]|nr:phosphotransferase [Candidatus Dormibacteraeota bacterium]